MLTFDLNVTMGILILNSLVQGFAVGLIWVPPSVVAFDTLAADDRAEASAVFHLLRNLGSSFFISLSTAEIVWATGANYSRMSEMISPYNTTLALPWAAGGWDWYPPSRHDRPSQRLHGVHRGLGPRSPVCSWRAAQAECRGAGLRAGRRVCNIVCTSHGCIECRRLGSPGFKHPPRLLWRMRSADASKSVKFVLWWVLVGGGMNKIGTQARM